MSQTETLAPPAKSRLGRLDVLRGIALIAMATYHTGWDFEFFGYMEPGTTGHGAWKLYARIIASTFLVLVGFSLVLAHRNGIRWRSFGIRLLQIVAASLAITLVTRYITPDSFVFFGILHEIAAASVLGLLFRRLRRRGRYRRAALPGLRCIRRPGALAARPVGNAHPFQ